MDLFDPIGPKGWVLNVTYVPIPYNILIISQLPPCLSVSYQNIFFVNFDNIFICIKFSVPGTIRIQLTGGQRVVNTTTPLMMSMSTQPVMAVTSASTTQLTAA